MSTYQVIAFLFFLPSCTYAQDCEEFKQHLQSIDRTYRPGHPVDRMDTVFNTNRAFVDYTIEHLLDKPSDKCFISNRNLLQPLKIAFCDSTKLIIKDKLQDGSTCKVTLTFGRFQVTEHTIAADEQNSLIDSIDGQRPYGGEYVLPKVEIIRLDIEINGHKLDIPKRAYANFFDPTLCQGGGFTRPVKAYESLTGQYLYVYFCGGEAASTYFAKLVFDRKGYLTRIISDYYPLSIHGSFRGDFIGF